VGIALADGVGLGQLELGVEVAGIGEGVLGRADVVGDGGLDGLGDEPVGRVEGGRRALGDVGDARAAKPALGGLAGRRQVEAVEHDRAAGDAAAGAGETHGGKAQRRLAGARLADQAQHLAAPQGQADALDDVVPGIVAVAVDPDVAHFQQHVAFGAIVLVPASVHP
jgi:hypothetical protein